MINPEGREEVKEALAAQQSGFMREKQEMLVCQTDLIHENGTSYNLTTRGDKLLKKDLHRNKSSAISTIDLRRNHQVKSALKNLTRVS